MNLYSKVTQFNKYYYRVKVKSGRQCNLTAQSPHWRPTVIPVTDLSASAIYAALNVASRK